MFERFTDRAREAVVQAQAEARLLRHDYIGTEHLLLGVLRDETGVGASVLDRFGIGLEGTRADVVRVVGEGPSKGDEKDAEALRMIGIDVDEVRRRIEELFGPGALDRQLSRRRWRRARCEPGFGHIPFTPRAKKVLELSLREALALGHKYIGTEHIVLGLAREGEGIGAQVLAGHGAESGEIRRLVKEEIERKEGHSGRTA